LHGGEPICIQSFSCNLEERHHLEDLHIHERVSEWSLNKQVERVWTEFI